MTEDKIINKLKAVLAIMRKNSTDVPPEECLGLVYGQIVELIVDLEDDL